MTWFSSILQALKKESLQNSISHHAQIKQLIDSWILNTYTYVRHNKHISSQHTDSLISMSSYYIHTYEETKSWNFPTNIWHLFQIQLPQVLFPYSIAIHPDMYDSLSKLIRRYIWPIVLYLIGIFQLSQELYTLLLPLSTSLAVSPVFLISLWSVLIILLYFWYLKKYLSTNHISVENIEFEEIFDVSCISPHTAREFLTLSRIEAITKRVMNLNVPKESDHGILFTQDKIFIYISHLEYEWNMSLKELFSSNTTETKQLLKKLEIEYLLNI